MKKSTLFSALLAVGLAGFGVAASAQEDERGMVSGREQGYRPIAVDRLKVEVNHLNRMMTHVERALRTYKAPKPLWRKYENVRQEVAVLSGQLRSKAIDALRLRKEIERMHAELHRIEVELRMPVQEHYKWR